MNIEFVSSIAVIAPDPAASCKLYVDTIGPSARKPGR